MARKRKDIRLPAPYLRTVRFDDPDEELPAGYPFSLPWLDAEFELEFETPVTVLIGENGSGKSTLLETLAALAGFSTSGGGAWAGDQSQATEGPAAMAARMRAGWLPKVQQGWFLKAQSFAAVSEATTKDYLAFSHGEGFSEIVMDRMTGQGVFFMDEPEAALSPRRQAELLAFLADFQSSGDSQVVMATHSPILMAVPGATLLRITRHGVAPVNLRETDHFRLWAAFSTNPDEFVAAALDGVIETLI